MPASVTRRVTGVDQATRRIRVAVAKRHAAAIDFLADEAQRILDASLQLCPEDEHVLKDSGHIVKAPSGDAFKIEYGGPGSGAEGYAVAVHEHVSIHDPPTWQGKTVHFTTGGPKFLSTPFNEAAATLPSRISRHIRHIR